MSQIGDEARSAYTKASRKGRSRYFSRVSQGKSGNLATLDSILQNATIVSEIDIGIHAIPLGHVVGTLSPSRAALFSADFLPLARPKSEFNRKWCDLYESHLKEGIRDPIKVFEYLNWFYVAEGNKRVSILKYVDAVSVEAQIIRLLPKKVEEDDTVKRYYDFIEFNRETGIFRLWIKREGGFKELLDKLKVYSPPLTSYTDKYRHFMGNVYLPFRERYLNYGGGDLQVTTGDAFLDFVRIYGIPDKVEGEKFDEIIQGIILEVKTTEESADTRVDSEPLTEKRSFITSLTERIGAPKTVKIAFVHETSRAASGWVDLHEQGREYIEDYFSDRIETAVFNDVPVTEEGAVFLRTLAESYDLIFATSPNHLQITLEAALEHPEVRFFNCNRRRTYKHVRTYFGRSYEVRYLLGIVAGTMTTGNTIGYIAASNTPETRASVNAFAMGAAAVNPRAEIAVRWTGEWDNAEASKEAAMEMCGSGADVISQNAAPPPGDSSGMYGLYGIHDKTGCGEVAVIPYARCVWNWGAFYEQIINYVIANTVKKIRDDFHDTPNHTAFWWGMDSQIIDVDYTRENLSSQVIKLVEHVKKMIIQKEYDIFEGPVADQAHKIRIEEGQTLEYSEMLIQEWLMENIRSGESTS